MDGIFLRVGELLFMKPISIHLQAYAKINFSLDVLEKRQDGFHNIRSIMQSISLYDRLSLTKTEGDISIECADPEVPCNDNNLAVRGAQELKQAAQVKAGVHIVLSKGIPVAAGLGGGSADVAAVLRGLNNLWNTGLDNRELREIGKRIGADVPFCLTGGTALAEGIGEVLTPLEDFPRLWLVLFKPAFGVSTPEVYRAHDRMERVQYRQDTEAVLAGVEKGDFEAMISGMGNMLQQITTGLYPEVGNIIHMLQKKALTKVFMCGSGPTVCAVVSDRCAAEELRRKCFAFSGKVYITHTVPRASILLDGYKRGEKVGGKEAYANKTGKLQALAGNCL